MTTRRRAFLMTVASIGAMGSACTLAAGADAAPGAATVAGETLGELRVVNEELRATNEQLQARLEGERAQTAMVAGMLRRQQARFEQLELERLRTEQGPTTRWRANSWHRTRKGEVLQDIATQPDEWWSRLKAPEALGRANTTSRQQRQMRAWASGA